MNNKHNEYQRNYRRRLRQRAVEALGGKCIQCGFDNWRALNIDHVYGGGSRETKSNPIKPQHDVVAGQRLDEFQLLCANCNSIKRYTNKEIIDDEYGSIG